jgi:hypothetical protein
MRARVARNVKGWNLPPSMDKDERIRFENTMEKAFDNFGIPGDTTVLLLVTNASSRMNKLTK